MGCWSNIITCCAIQYEECSLSLSQVPHIVYYQAYSSFLSKAVF